MGYRGLITGNVDKAFKLLKDLVVQTTLSSKTDGGFDFTTNMPLTVTTTTKIIPAIALTKKNRSDSNPSVSLQHSFIFKAKDLPAPDVYDTISVVGGETWQVIPPYDNDGYIVTVSVARSK